MILRIVLDVPRHTILKGYEKVATDRRKSRSGRCEVREIGLKPRKFHSQRGRYVNNMYDERRPYKSM